MFRTAKLTTLPSILFKTGISQAAEWLVTIVLNHDFTRKVKHCLFAVLSNSHSQRFSWRKPSAKSECYCYIARYTRFLQRPNCERRLLVMSSWVLALHGIRYIFVATKLNSTRFTAYLTQLLGTQVHITATVQQSKRYFPHVPAHQKCAHIPRSAQLLDKYSEHSPSNVMTLALKSNPTRGRVFL